MRGCRIAAVGLVLAAAVLAGCEDAATKARRAQQDADRSLIGAGQLALERRLKDPRSVQYGTVTVSRRADIVTVCGAYNAKNSFGGYTGEKPFFTIGQLAIIPGDLSRPDFERERKARC
jgi:hypothetical protein